ncbi:hypothetical protein [uncultured Spongiibacter sp.]|uniref:hypothetical protein n=1 Tax=uncultured Spongiibacter sp. TaxID=870896 RepID=UPI000C4F82AF|nr:hypothetical protein [uncultured Spongiibacter sp.]MAY35693.1 hypothetical protein [Spongiibacteraceae bacterium]
MNHEPELEYSALSQEIASDGKSVSVEIYRADGDEQWLLEVVDEFGNSTVWDDTFSDESDALAEVKKTIRSDGIDSLIGPEGDEGKEGWG